MSEYEEYDPALEVDRAYFDALMRGEIGASVGDSLLSEHTDGVAIGRDMQKRVRVVVNTQKKPAEPKGIKQEIHPINQVSPQADFPKS